METGANPFSYSQGSLGDYVLPLFAHLGFVGLGISVPRLIHSKNLTNFKTMAIPWSLCATNADRIGLTILLVELLLLRG